MDFVCDLLVGGPGIPGPLGQCREHNADEVLLEVLLILGISVNCRGSSEGYK